MVKEYWLLTFNLIFLSTQETTLGIMAGERVGEHLFLSMNFLTRHSRDAISQSHAYMPPLNFAHKSFKLQLVVSKCSAHCSGVAGAPHLEGGYCHELIIFMTSSHILKASTKSLDHSEHTPTLLPIHSDTLQTRAVIGSAASPSVDSPTTRLTLWHHWCHTFQGSLAHTYAPDHQPGHMEVT